MISDRVFEFIFDFASSPNSWSINKTIDELILSIFESCLPFKVTPFLLDFFEFPEEGKRILEEDHQEEEEPNKKQKK